ncbi:MAG: patatin-like phospholipase family protein [Xanthobacteraceae bacterium]
MTAILAAPVFVPPELPFAAASAHAQNSGGANRTRRSVAHAKKAPAPPSAAPQQQLPPRVAFTAAEDAAAGIPGMPDARFWADSVSDFNRAVPTQPGPWLILSTGGSDGAFGAGLLNGLSAAGNRPAYSVVTGVSTGALMAPFAFAGSRYDDALKAAYTQISAADVFEVGSTGESFVDSWPLKDLIAKQITPALLADIAAEHRRGRRLFVITTNLDAQRSVVWNMGAIAVHATTDGGDAATAALNLFRSVLLASGSVPGAFPPVLIDVESGGKKFAEMHADGGVGGQFFVAPLGLTASNSGYRIPATQLYIVVNSGLQPEFAVVQPSTASILTQAVGMAVNVDLRVMLDRIYVAAKNGGAGFNVAAIPADFSAPSRGPFDPKYMGALFNLGFDQGKSATPFLSEPPPFPGQPAAHLNDETQPQPGDLKPGADR